MKSLLAHVKTLAVGLLVGGISGTALVVVAVAVVAAVIMPTGRRVHAPDPPSLIERVREVAKLESLDVSVYKKVDFAPDPPPSNSMVGDLANWAEWSIRAPEGKAIVFADAHLKMDVSKIDGSSILVEGDCVTMSLPPITASIELRPGETEVIQSNLDSKGTGALLEKARWEIQADVDHDADLKARARTSAERSLRALFVGAGFKTVRFVDGPILLPSA